MKNSRQKYTPRRKTSITNILYMSRNKSLPLEFIFGFSVLTNKERVVFSELQSCSLALRNLNFKKFQFFSHTFKICKIFAAF